MLNSENTFPSFVDGIISRLEASGFNYKISNNNNGDFSTLVMHFDMGKNGLYILKHICNQY
jgi:hypothetical protein